MNKTSLVTRFVRTFLLGAVCGIACFGYLATAYGLLIPSPLFPIAFPLGLTVATLLLLLSDWVGELLSVVFRKTETQRERMILPQQLTSPIDKDPSA